MSIKYFLTLGHERAADCCEVWLEERGEVGGGPDEGVADDHEAGAGEGDQPGGEGGVTHPAQHRGGQHRAQGHHLT